MVREQAKAGYRSLNQQIIMLLEQALKINLTDAGSEP